VPAHPLAPHRLGHCVPRDPRVRSALLASGRNLARIGGSACTMPRSSGIRSRRLPVRD
jgi:hypothetical protein